MIVIPMAGLSRRFSEAGYTTPKYMLPLNGESVFSHAIKSFSKQFDSEYFLFIARDINGTGTFIDKECRRLCIKNFRVVILSGETDGQAETVALGLDARGVSDLEAVTIFNIDTFRAGFKYPTTRWFANSDGYLEVFEGTGPNWSYVEPDSIPAEARVRRTAEKEIISNLCCNGLYHFARACDFRRALKIERLRPQTKELYIAPLYNHLISEGRQINYNKIDRNSIIFCGVPHEYEILQR